jgi:hypothetical protein
MFVAGKHMKNRTRWFIIAAATLSICILAYLLFFVWKLNYYIGFVIALGVASMLYISKKKNELIQNRRKILQQSAIVLGLMAIYTNLYLGVSVLHMDIAYLFIVSIIVSIIGGVLIFDMARSIIYLCFSASSGMAIATTLVTLPALLKNDYALFNYVLLPTIQSMALPLIFTFTVSLFGAMIGYFIADSLG